ncbi:ABC transporter substrate-binding protein [Candidatus Caldatribacterium saccharofermentans]|uniref:ABC transporter substrate-binding protein n=1 Tax=Candidatus Caldatribacterium saccharofermentans TaxID=1454753 RepID=UPI003CFC80C0
MRKAILFVTVLTLLAGISSSVVGAGAKEEITISMWTHDNLYVEFFTRRGEEWAAIHPEYKVNFDFVQIPYDQLWPKILTALAAGKGVPDLIGIEINAFSRFMKGDIAEKTLVDLTPLIGAEREKFLRWEPYMYKGKIYGIESALCPVVFYYRKTVFDEAGITTPLETWEEFVQAGRKLKEKGYYIAAVESSGDAPHHFLALYYQQDGAIFDSEGNLMAEDDPRAIQALRLLQEGVQEGILWPTSSYYGAPHFAALKEGKVVGNYMPDWWSVYYQKPQVPEQAGEWRIQLLPAWRTGGRRSSTAGGTGFAITKYSKNPELVFDFLHYTYMTKENQIKRFLELQYFPTMIEAITDPRVTEFSDPYYGGQNVGKVFSEAALQVPTQWQSPYWSEAMQTLYKEAVTPALAGKKMPEQAIKDAVSKIRELMK